ncbi:MAG: hypothetical protein WC044_06585 [Crocinitomicaceae bacterium]
MNRISLICFLAFFIPQIQAQTASNGVEVTSSKPYGVVNGEKYYFQRNQEILTVKVESRRCAVQKFSGVNFDEEKRSKFYEYPIGFMFEGCVELQNKIYLFFSNWDEVKRNEKLFYQEIDYEECAFVGEATLLFTVDEKVAGVQYNTSLLNPAVSTYHKFNFYTNSNSSKVIVHYRRVPEKKRDALSKDIIGMHCFDAEMEKLWNDDVEMPYTEKMMDPKDYTIDNEGNGYILANVFNDNSRKITNSQGEPNYRCEVVRVSASNREIQTFTVDLDRKFISSVNFFKGKKSELIIAGFYGKDKSLRPDGIFHSTFENGMGESNFYEIPIATMKTFLSPQEKAKLEKEEKKGEANIPHLSLVNVDFSKDGSTTFFCEQNYITLNGQSVVYHSDDVYVVRMDANQEFQWAKKIPKKQENGTISMRGMRCYTAQTENYTYVIFLDNAKNEGIKENTSPEKYYDGREAILTAYKIENQTGETSRLSLLNTKNFNGMTINQFETSRILRMKDNEFVFEVYKKEKEDIMIKIKFKE